SAIDRHAVVRDVPDGGVTGAIRSDEVALDEIADGESARDVDPVSVPGDHVAIRSQRAADHVVRGIDREDAKSAVGARGRPRRVGAEVVSADEVAAAMQEDAATREAVDHEPAD